MLLVFFLGISQQTLYRQLCRGDETLSGWHCKDCSQHPPPQIWTDDSIVDILLIAETMHLTADERHDVHNPTYGDLLDEAMKADVVSVSMILTCQSTTLQSNCHQMLVLIWILSQDTEVTHSFNIDTSFQVTEDQEEESIQEATLQLRLNHVCQPDFHIVLTCSKMYCPKLLEADGYSYTIKRKRAGVTYWWCSVCSKKLRCPATIIQRGDCFERGQHRHVHSIDPGIISQIKVSSELDESQFPGRFLRKDLHVGSKRHILLATDTQLEVLGRAKVWKDKIFVFLGGFDSRGCRVPDIIVIGSHKSIMLS